MRLGAKFGLFVGLLLLALGIGSASAGRPIDRESASQLAIDEVLRQFAGKYELSLVADVEGNVLVDVPSKTVDPVLMIESLAARAKRMRTSAEGVVILCRWPYDIESRQTSRVSRIVSWVSALQEPQLRLAAHGQLRAADLAPSEWLQLLRDIPLGDGFQDTSSGNLAQIQIDIRAVACFDYKDPTSGQLQTSYIRPKKLSPLSADQLANFRQAANAQERAAYQLPRPKTPGRTDAVLNVPGQRITVRELMIMAGRIFNVEYAYDERLAASTLFVSGQFTKSVFEAAMAKTIMSHPPYPKTSRNDLVSELLQRAANTGLLDILEREAPSVLDSRTLVHKPMLESSALSGVDPSLRALFQRIGVGSSEKIQVRPGILLSLRDASGKQFAVLLSEKP